MFHVRRFVRKRSVCYNFAEEVSHPVLRGDSIVIDRITKTQSVNLRLVLGAYPTDIWIEGRSCERERATSRDDDLLVPINSNHKRKRRTNSGEGAGGPVEVC